MISMTLPALAAFFGLNPETYGALTFTGVTIDSRGDCSGKLFIALRGERFDGHDYIASAYANGAVAALVEAPVDCAIAQFPVADCAYSMAALANHWRHSCSATVIALTGSNGKTTVKEMLRQILEREAPTLATGGNFNNHIGLPLTLFGLAPEHRYAIVEMGANHAGEIATLACIAEPDLVYVNNVAAAHLAGFGSLQGVIEAKGELYAYCQPSQRALFNLDEAASAYWRSICAASEQLGCALEAEAEVRAQWQGDAQGLSLEVSYEGRSETTRLAVQGEHNARNALAAISLALLAGVEFSTAVQNLAGFAAVKGRLQFLPGPHQSCLINDTYNANPDSLVAGIKVVCALPGKAWLALGDMGELGDDAEALHLAAAQQARQLGVEKFFGIGPMSCSASVAFAQTGYCFDHIDDMANSILGQLHPQVNLLVKGSRSAGMEKLVEALVEYQVTEELNHAV